MPQAPIRIYAPPKVNLTLKILGRRPDGYHELRSIVAFASAGGDWLELFPNDATSIEVVGPFAHDISGQNSLQQTVDALLHAEPRLQIGKIKLEKKIPVASGIGGGSTDAAALLKAVAKSNPDLANNIDLHRIAAILGADVPACLAGRATEMSGIGELLRPLPGFSSLACVLAAPEIKTPADKTAQVFKRLNAPLHAPTSNETNNTPPPLRDTTALITYVLKHQNDLLPPASELFPEIIETLDELECTNGCRVARLSGAGPTCFGLYDDHIAAEQAARTLASTHPAWWIHAVTLN